MSAPEDDVADIPLSPLQQLTTGGWLKGVLRLFVGAAVVGAVLYFTGHEAWSAFTDPKVLPLLVVGSVVHAAQRFSRIRKWALMIASAPLAQPGWPTLLRIQFVGMLANLVVPVSEALKIWVVARRKSQVLVATESVAVDTAVHSLLVGTAGLGAAALLTEDTPSLMWITAGSVSGASLALLCALRYWPRAKRPNIGFASGPIVAWAIGEAGAQLAIYALAVHAVGVELSAIEIIALAPILFLTDLFVLTPAGLGAREALFAAAFGALSDNPAGLGAAVGLTISAMLVLAALVGGAVALLAPDRAKQAVG